MILTNSQNAKYFVGDIVNASPLENLKDKFGKSNEIVSKVLELLSYNKTTKGFMHIKPSR